MKLYLSWMVLVFAPYLSSCQRSPQYFKPDEEFSKSSSEYYSNSLARRGNQKFESLGQPKKSVLVFDFWNDTPIKADIGPFVSSELKRGLTLTERVILQEDMKSELNTEDFIGGDRIKVAQLIQEGRKLGVSVILIGRISKILRRHNGAEVGLFRKNKSGTEVEVEAKVFDVQSGREIMATTQTGEATHQSLPLFESGDEKNEELQMELTQAAAREAVARLLPDIVRSIEKMTWQGRISKIMGPKVFINAGRTSGLIQGDILKVLAQGEDIYDPTSGSYLGRSKGQLKGTLEISDFIGTDGSVAQIHTGGNFREGDSVQLY